MAVTLDFAGHERLLGTVLTDGGGAFMFILDTWQAFAGNYVISAGDNAGIARLNLEMNHVFLLREQQDTGLTLTVMEHIYVPMMVQMP